MEEAKLIEFKVNAAQELLTALQKSKGTGITVRPSYHW
jgi:hypothetical protein